MIHSLHTKATVFCGYLSSGSPGEVAVAILLMEEILHHQGCIKCCESWDKLPTSTGYIAGFLPATVAVLVGWRYLFLKRNLGNLLCVPISVPVEAGDFVFFSEDDEFFLRIPWWNDFHTPPPPEIPLQNQTGRPLYKTIFLYRESLVKFLFKATTSMAYDFARGTFLTATNSIQGQVCDSVGLFWDFNFDSVQNP